MPFTDMLKPGNKGQGRRLTGGRLRQVGVQRVVHGHHQSARLLRGRAAQGRVVNVALHTLGDAVIYVDRDVRM